MKDIKYAFASNKDKLEIQSLLEKSNLPSHELSENIDNFLIAKNGEGIIGTIGLEVYRDTGLLRSLCIEGSCQRNGIGKELVGRLLSHAHLQNINELFLLTLTAGDFFKKLGFNTIIRENAPGSIKISSEFQSICPETAVCMYLKISGLTQYHPRETLVLKTDGPGVKMWGVSLDKTQFTYFEVERNSHFEQHSHESEQITMVLEGELFFDVAGHSYCVKKDEVIAIPSDIPHAVFTKEKSVKAVDAWSPLNKRYI